MLKTFTGHSYDVTLLYYIHPRESSNGYFISASKVEKKTVVCFEDIFNLYFQGDRLLSCWSLDPKLDDKNAVANFTTEDVSCNVSVVVTSDGTANLSAITRSGVVHIFRHKPNG